MKHRIFIALGTSDGLVNAIASWEASFASESEDTYSKIRWLRRENLHITLVPPWYEDESGVEKVKGLLDSIGKEKFSLEFRRVTYGPNSKRPRLIWLEGETSCGLVDLRDNLHGMLGKKQEKRPFLLHLTIGRFQENAFSSFPVKEIDDKFIFQEEANSLLLIESHLERNGAKYNVLHQIDL